VPTASKKAKKKKSQKAKQFFLTPTASKISQICEIWHQKSPSGNPASAVLKVAMPPLRLQVVSKQARIKRHARLLTRASPFRRTGQPI